MIRCFSRAGAFVFCLIGLLGFAAFVGAATSEPGKTPDTETAPVAPPETLASLPPYLPKAPIEGELKLAGSSAMNQLAHLWGSGLAQLHPGVKLTVETYESGQVLPRLAKGEMQIGLMSRPLTESELKAGGIVAFATAKDVLGIVVNADNPLEALTLEQGVALLRDPQAADKPGAKTWGELGVGNSKDGDSKNGPAKDDNWKDEPITLYGRSAGAGAWGYLVNRFLGEGVASRTATDCSGYADICQCVCKNRGGVGYVSLSLAPPDSGKILPLQLTTGELIPAPKPGEAVDPRYPLVRELYVVLKWKEGEPLSPVAEELLRYVLSRSGQEDAVKAGFLPMRRDEVLAARDQLGWTGKR
jgi:phosphate transport system substrate-binding protein